jgi:GntR family transcriptional regulator
MEPDLLRRDIGASLHHQVFSVLRSGILSGRSPVGSYLPSEDALTREFGVSRATIRRAMQSLESEGLIDRKQGRGTRVVSSGSSALPMSQHMRKFGDPLENSTVRILDFGQASPPPDVADALDLAAGDSALKITRLRVDSNGSPLRLLTNYLPNSIAGSFSADDLVSRTMLEALRLHGFDCFRAEDEFGAVLADGSMAMLLDVRIGAALLEYRRIFFDQQRRPICHQLTLLPERTRMRQVIEADADIPLSPEVAVGKLASRPHKAEGEEG